MKFKIGLASYYKEFEFAGNKYEITAGPLSILTGTVGYRYQSKTGGFVFKVSLTPFFNFHSFIPFGGVAIGYSF